MEVDEWGVVGPGAWWVGRTRTLASASYLAASGPDRSASLSTTRLVVDTLVAAGLPVHGTAQPSRAPLGELARHGTDTYRGMALAWLCAADRHHQLEVEIKPALRADEIVVCDRYLASSLVLQGLDGLSSDTVWQLNHGLYRPGLAVILNGDPQVIGARLQGRGGHSRFERAEDNSDLESGRYVHHSRPPLTESDTMGTV